MPRSAMLSSGSTSAYCYAFADGNALSESGTPDLDVHADTLLLLRIGIPFGGKSILPGFLQ